LPARPSDLARIDPVRIYILAGGQPTHDLILRIRGNRGRALAAVQAAVESIDPKLLPGLALQSIEDGNIAALRAFYRVMAGVAGVLTLLGITLAVVGIYGVTAFLVSQRTREIGIRAALGATSRTLLKGFVLDGLRPVVIGMVFGFAAALSLDAWYRSTDLALARARIAQFRPAGHAQLHLHHP
jgi:ABC-type lipoprotein release transport system permease subunit